MGNKKTVLRLLTAGLTGVLFCSGCGKEKVEKSELSLLIEETLRAGYHAVEEAAMAAKTDAKEAEAAVWEKLLGKNGNCRYILHPEDFVPEEIACANVFATYQDGWENPVLSGLYEEAGEAWQYLYYVEYDINSDGRMDYVAVHSNPDNGTEKNGFCGGDVWCLSEDGDYERVLLPEAFYMTGGTWQEPKLFMMTLVYRYNRGSQGIAVYHDDKKQEMALYGWHYNYEEAYNHAEEVYKRVRVVLVTEEIGDMTLVQTGFPLLYNPIGVYEQVRMEIKGRENNPAFYQVFFVRRIRDFLSYGGETCVVWDGNDDGYEDILYYAGYDGGSAGTFSDYKLFVWSEEEGKYIRTELPLCVSINYEAHKLYNCGQSGAPHQFYDIYGLQDGEYQVEKELDLHYDSWKGDERVNIAVYSEYGEIVEETDITGLDWEETQELLEEKYPDFHFWRQG